MASVTQYYDHQISDVLLLIWDCDKVDRRGGGGIKSAGAVDSAEMSIIYGTPQKY